MPKQTKKELEAKTGKKVIVGFSAKRFLKDQNTKN